MRWFYRTLCPISGIEIRPRTHAGMLDGCDAKRAQTHIDIMNMMTSRYHYELTIEEERHQREFDLSK